MDDRPAWLRVGEDIIGPLLTDTRGKVAQFAGADYHVAQMPLLALYHLAQSLDASIDSNEKGRHAVALSLARQAIEALTIVELGMLSPAFSYPLLEKWHAGSKSHGDLRKALELSIWSGYGSGLWEEPWAEFIASLAKAVQPYAHCTPELLQWNLAVISTPAASRFLVGVGSYDTMKASRVTLLHVLVTWTLGRILFANFPSHDGLVTVAAIGQLGASLASSEFLIKGQDWSVQLWPHMFLK